MQFDAAVCHAEPDQVMQQSFTATEQMRGVGFGAAISEHERVGTLEKMQASHRLVAMALQAVQAPFAQAGQVGHGGRLIDQPRCQRERGIWRFRRHLGEQVGKQGHVVFAAEAVGQFW